MFSVELTNKVVFGEEMQLAVFVSFCFDLTRENEVE